MNSFEKKALRQASDLNRAAREFKRLRLIEAKRKNPDMPASKLAEQFGVSPKQVKTWLTALHPPNPLPKPAS
jgi:uncharacterized protein YjcR